jgi:hypothetical protein
MAMNAGITAIGSVITKIEVTVSEAYSARVTPEITPPHQNAPAILACVLAPPRLSLFAHIGSKRHLAHFFPVDIESNKLSKLFNGG